MQGRGIVYNYSKASINYSREKSCVCGKHCGSGWINVDLTKEFSHTRDWVRMHTILCKRLKFTDGFSGSEEDYTLLLFFLLL